MINLFPQITKCKMSILAMDANAAKVTDGSYAPNIEAK
jgi:hypothetical protein